MLVSTSKIQFPIVYIKWHIVKYRTPLSKLSIIASIAHLNHESAIVVYNLIPTNAIFTR